MLKIPVSLAVLTVVLTALTGCKSGNSPGDLYTYNGNTQPATLSSTAIANVYINHYSAANYSLTASDLTGTRSAINLSAQTRTPSIRAARPVNDTYSGTCEGYIDYNGSYDNQIDYIDVLATASNYCEYDEVYNGYLFIEGYGYDLELGFDNFNYRDDYYGTSFTLNGSLRIEDGYPLSLSTSNVVIQDNRLNQTTLLRNWREWIDHSQYPETLQLSGELYDDTWGYVLVDTLERLVMGDYDQYESGTIRLLGDRSTAWVTFFGSGYLIEVDANNDSFIDEDDLFSY